MIGNNSKHNGTPVPFDTIVGEGTQLEGGLTSPGSVRVDGSINGPVNAKNILIGTKASVFGDITAQSVVIGGAIHGNITAESIDIQSGAQVVGDLKTQCICIAEGAAFEGRCSMAKNPSPEPVASLS